eukprot:3909991-Pleurochrysis_carterae.AAC.1
MPRAERVACEHARRLRAARRLLGRLRRAGDVRAPRERLVKHLAISTRARQQCLCRPRQVEVHLVDRRLLHCRRVPAVERAYLKRWHSHAL